MIWNPKTQEERELIISLVKQAYMRGVYDTVNQSKTRFYAEDLVPPVLDENFKEVSNDYR